MQTENKFHHLVERLCTRRDELRVKIQLGQIEAKDEWQVAEETWGKFEQALHAHASRSKKTAIDIGEELGRTYQRNRGIL